MPMRRTMARHSGAALAIVVALAMFPLSGGFAESAGAPAAPQKRILLLYGDGHREYWPPDPSSQGRFPPARPAGKQAVGRSEPGEPAVPALPPLPAPLAGQAGWQPARAPSAVAPMPPALEGSEALRPLPPVAPEASSLSGRLLANPMRPPAGNMRPAGEAASGVDWQPVDTGAAGSPALPPAAGADERMNPQPSAEVAPLAATGPTQVAGPAGRTTARGSTGDLERPLAAGLPAPSLPAASAPPLRGDGLDGVESGLDRAAERRAAERWTGQQAPAGQLGEAESGRAWSGPVAARPAAGQTRDLVVLGAAQLVGTLLGFLLGLLACGLAGWLVLRRTGWSRLEPIVRLEVSGSTLSLIEGIQSRVAATGSAIGQPVPGCPGDPTKPGTGQADRRVGATTAVADFADQALPLAGLFVEEHAKQADERRRQEQEILQRVLADNLALQQQISARAPAA